MHSGTAKDLASHGYMVFIMDHRDKTSSYVEDKDGNGQYYDNSHLAYDYDYRREQIKVREAEVSALIDELEKSNTIMRDVLGFPQQVKLDFSKLIIGGHSFGGITAISVAR